MILDVFTYCGEQHWLDARVKTLAECDVRHLAVLANRSHQGDAWSDQSIGDWVAQCADVGVTVHLVDLSHLDDTPRGGAGNPGYQVRERHHRIDASRTALRMVNDTDLIALSDVDEIPRPELLSAVQPDDIAPAQVFAFAQRMHVWGPEWLYPGPWLGTTITTRVTVEAFGLQYMRDTRGTPKCRVLGEDGLRGGWHLSWWGTDAARRRKLWTFSHYELVGKQDDLAWLAEHGVDINGLQLERVEPDTLDWPEGVTV